MYVFNGLLRIGRNIGTDLCAFVMRECDPVEISLSPGVTVTITR